MAPEGKIFDLKPELTLAMKLAATFAITYYLMLFLFEVLTLVFFHYSIDSYYLGSELADENDSRNFIYLIIELVLSGVLVFSLIQIFRKKVYGKAIFVVVSLILIAFQLWTTGVHPWVKYALEVLTVLFIAPVKVKKKRKLFIPITSPVEEEKSPEEKAEPSEATEPNQ